MADRRTRIDIFYSLQSDYCFFLLDRLLGLAGQGVEVAVRQVLRGVIRMPERFRDRDALEQGYFATDAQRTADLLDLAYACPDPSPIAFKSGSLWVAEPDQPRNEHLHRLYVGAVRAGRGLEFPDHVGRMPWDGSTPGCNKGDHLSDAMAAAGLDMGSALHENTWGHVEQELEVNNSAMPAVGHCGVPLMVYEDEPFYGQDRFDRLVWRMGEVGAC